jgi:hypothetical protein
MRTRGISRLTFVRQRRDQARQQRRAHRFEVLRDRIQHGDRHSVGIDRVLVAAATKLNVITSCQSRATSRARSSDAPRSPSGDGSIAARARAASTGWRRSRGCARSPRPVLLDREVEAIGRRVTMKSSPLRVNGTASA